MATLFSKAITEIGALNQWLRSIIMAWLYTSNLYQYAENVGTMAYTPSRLYYANGKYYYSWYKLPGSPNNYDGMVCTYDGERVSENELARAGTEGDNDSHVYTAIIVDDNGYIYACRNTSDDLQEVKIAKSDNPYDISSFTIIQTITNGVSGVSLDGHSYPCFQKIGTDIFLILRNGAPGYRIHKKGLIDETFSNGYRFVEIPEKSYKCLLRNSSENKIGMATMVREQIGAYTYRQLGYIETLDGVTWKNAGGTWSKNVVTNGYVTDAEIIANCIIEYNPNPNEDHWFATDGMFVNGVPYLLVEEGYSHTPNEATLIDYSDINIRYWSDGTWQKKSISASITGIPYTYSYGSRALYHISHDGSKFLLFVLSQDYKTVTKYSSSDLISWTNHGTILSSSTFIYGIGGSCLNRNDLAFFSFNNGGVYNVIFHKY